jgi:hypothetical protein
MTTFYKWFFYVMEVLFTLLAILKSMAICIEHHLGYIPCALLAMAIFACLSGFLYACFAVSKLLIYRYAEVYKTKVIPRIEMQAIDRYIAEHPLPEIKKKEKEDDVAAQNLEDSNRAKNAQMNLERFMATCKIEREAMMAQKGKDDAEKLEKVLSYTRRTFMKFDFTDEKLFQLSECVKTFVTLYAVLPAMSVHIQKKRTLTQGDLKNILPINITSNQN